MPRWSSTRQVLGTFVHDWPRFLWCLRPGSRCEFGPWVRMRNRQDRLILSPDGRGAKCDWECTRQLHLCNVFPITGRWLLQRALRDWPIRLQEAPEFVSAEKVCWSGGRRPVTMAEGGKLKAENGAPEADECTEEGLPTNHTNAHEWGEGTLEQDGGSGGDRRDAVRLPHSAPPTSDLRLPTSALSFQLSALTPQVSFLIGHRGEERLPLLLATLKSIAGQRGVSVECLVVEQDAEPRIRNRLPGWVRYVHTPPPDPGMPYCRSWAFNVAAREARGEVLICHDNDMLTPSDYAAQAAGIAASGYEVMQPKRFVFYLDSASTLALGTTNHLPAHVLCENVVENLEGGGSVAITRDAYAAIGGMDEEFVGWGGEDVELWDRCQTLRVYPYGHLPLVHLWHAAAPKKASGDRNNDLMSRKLGVPAAARVEALRRGGPRAASKDTPSGMDHLRQGQPT